MCLSAILGVGSALIGARSARKAANTQADAAQAAAQVQKEIFDQTSEYFAPYREAGENALRPYVDQIGTEFTKTPGYDFRLQQGLDAIEGSAAARGGLYSGATMQALQNYGQDYATNAYEGWLNRLGGLTNMGQASAGQQAAAGQNFANATGNYLTQAGNAQAAGTMAVGNALNQGFQSVMPAIYNYQSPQTLPAGTAPTVSPRPMPRPY